MKNIKKLLKRFTRWVKRIAIQIQNFFVDIAGWFASLWIILFRDIKRPAIFYGYSVWWFGKYYARKRDRKWKANFDQMGKEQGIFPIDDIKLIVCSRLELKHFQKMGVIGYNVNVRKYFKRANYFKSGYIIKK
jgi:hypothetical protein